MCACGLEFTVRKTATGGRFFGIISTMKIKGTITAMVTPFAKDGSVDYGRLASIVEAQVAGGVEGICAVGTSGESPTLSHEEHHKVIEKTIGFAGGKVAIVAGTGANSTSEAVSLTEAVISMGGADATLQVTPYYNKPNQEGMYRHFKAIADSTSLPIYLYNVPGRTGVNMHPETTVRLARECKNIVGFKAASGNLDQIKRLIALKPETLDVLSGDDALTYEIMKAGGTGVISVFGNVYPKEFVALVRLMQAGRYDDAKVLNDRYSEIYKLLFADGNPGGAKAQLSNMGYVKNILRLPLVPANEEVREALREADVKLKASSILY